MDIDYRNPHVDGPTAEDRETYCSSCGTAASELDAPLSQSFRGKRFCQACDGDEDWTAKPLPRCNFSDSLTRKIQETR